MKRVGIAGAMMFDGDMGAPTIVPERVTVLSPRWYANLEHAARESDRLGLEFAMAAGPGWSETGGPWVRPEWGMKKFVWSETRIAGGQVRPRLAALPAVSGPFQNVPLLKSEGAAAAIPSLARDVAVIAYRTPEGDVPLEHMRPTLSSNAAGMPLDMLTDGELGLTVTLPEPAPGRPTWVRYDFAGPRTIRALTYAGPLGGAFAEGPSGRIEASDDGRTWRSLRVLVGEAHNPAPERTFAFPAATARSFRVTFDRGVSSREPWVAVPGIRIAELALVPGARVDLFEDRAGFGVGKGIEAIRTPEVAKTSAISSRDIVDLTGRLGSDGVLDWKAPPGEWTILRGGWSLTGRTNHPATLEGTGLEVDKLNAAHVRAHLEAYLAPVIARLGDFSGSRGLRYLLTDSWEAGAANWTEAMPTEFRRRRGYDLLRMLPVLAGHVVDSAERSDSFLWDFRRTIADLVAENHYGTITRFAKEHGLGYYGEAVGAAWPTIADGMLAKSMTDIPMGEFWTMPFGGAPTAYQQTRSDEFPADIIETRSTAHVYGRRLVAAEALTSSLPQWTSTPWRLKWVADRYMAMGVNRLVIHTSPHQPDDVHKPGLTLGPFGQVFTRHETWGEMAKPWMDYLSRGSFLLQQGVPVADVLYFYGEGAPSGVPYNRQGEPADLREYGFDYVNSDALLRLAKVEGGQIVFPGGARYRMLVLPAEADRMTLPMITRLRDLVGQGAVIVGGRPSGSPSLGASDAAVQTIADQLWGHTDGRTLTLNRFGRGRVYWRRDVTGVLAEEGLAPDLQASPPDPSFDLRFAHRRTDREDIYFIANGSSARGVVPVRFRVSDAVPERWDAATGEVSRVTYRQVDGRIEVPLRLDPYDSAFVIFRKEPAGRSAVVPPPVERTLATFSDWRLSVPADGGAPKVFTAGAGTWTASPLSDVRFFSGVATYRRSLSVRSSWLRSGSRLLLDLGEVGDVAEVRINGLSVGTAWKPPYRLDVTGVLRPGRNMLEVRVANTWQNRLVGDLQPGAAKRAWTNAAAGGGFSVVGGELSPSTPLTPSGLLRPVRLVRME